MVSAREPVAPLAAQTMTDQERRERINDVLQEIRDAYALPFPNVDGARMPAT